MTGFSHISAAALAVALTLGAGSGAAATLDFTYDPAMSSITVTNTANGLLCGLTGCGLTASLIAPTTTATLGTGDSVTLPALSFGTQGLGMANFTVTATLAFTGLQPFSATITGTGTETVPLFGAQSGSLVWVAQPGPLTLPDGSIVSLSFATPAAFTGGAVTSTATLTATYIAPAPSPVPLPATGLLLAGALGGLGLLRRRARAA